MGIARTPFSPVHFKSALADYATLPSTNSTSLLYLRVDIGNRLLTPDEEMIDQRRARLRSNISLLAERLVGTTEWLPQ